MRDFVKDCYIRQGGRILPWGMIRIFNNHVIDDPENNEAGLAFFSSELLPYGSEKYYAQIVVDKVAVFEKKSNKKMCSIREKNLYPAIYVTTQEVVRGGYLFASGFYGQAPFQDVDWEPTLQALEKATEGDYSPLLSDRTFLKVSKNLEGESLILLDLNLDCEESSSKLFTFTGTPVYFQVEHFSEKKEWLPDSLFV